MKGRKTSAVSIVLTLTLAAPCPAAPSSRSTPVPARTAGAGEPGALTSAIAAIATAEAPSLSPDGRRVAFVSDEGGQSQLWVVPRAGGPAIRLTSEVDPVGSVYWSPRGDRLAYTVLPGGSNAAQVHVIGADGRGARRVTTGSGQTHDLGGWTADGRRLLLASTAAARPDAFQPLLLDPDSGTIAPVGPARALSTLSALSADGRWALVSRTVRWEDSEVALVDVATGAERNLTRAGGAGSYWTAAMAPDGRQAWITGTINGSDRQVLGRVRLDGRGGAGPLEVVAARPDAELEGAYFDPRCSHALLVWNVDGRSEVEWLDVATGRRSRGPSLPVDIVRTPQVDATGAVFTGLGAARPGDLYRIDRRHHEVVQLTRSRHDGIDLAALVQPTLFRYRARDGLALSGWLYRPAGFKAPGPVVELYHGGPEDQARPRLDAYVQSLVASGIAVFAANVRGSSGYGRRFMQLDNGPARARAITDIADTTSALVEAGVADRARIGIQGGSYGGYLTLSGITDFPDMFAAAVDIYGVSDLESMFRTMQP